MWRSWGVGFMECARSVSEAGSRWQGLLLLCCLERIVCAGHHLYLARGRRSREDRRRGHGVHGYVLEEAPNHTSRMFEYLPCSVIGREHSTCTCGEPLCVTFISESRNSNANTVEKRHRCQVAHGRGKNCVSINQFHFRVSN